LVEFWDAVLQILLVVIPTLIGSYSTKLIVNKWQERKEEFELNKSKFQLRKDIQKDFQKGLAEQISTCYDFINKITVHYASLWKVGSDKKIVKNIGIPREGDDLPHIIFEDELINYRRKVFKDSRFMWELFSTLKVYYKSKKIDEEYSELISKLTFIIDLFNVLLDKDNNEDFQKNYELLKKELGELKIKSSNFVATLADTSLKKM